MQNGEIILYNTEDGKTSIQFRAEEGTVWLTRTEIGELFQTTPQNITQHIQGIYEENEADPLSTSKDYLLVQKEGKRDIEREVKMLWALAGQTAAELIYYRSNSPVAKYGAC